MSEELKCPICGKPTFLVYGKNPRKDRLCKDCSQKLFNKEIKQCEDCGKWHKTNELCECKTNIKKSSVNENKDSKITIISNEDNKTCVVCGEPSGNKPQCKSCFFETRDFMEVLDKNSSTRKTRDYYYNLKERILIIKSIDEAQKQCNKLIAIAMVADTYNDDTSLIDRVYKDVESLMKGKQKPKPNDKFVEERKENDENKSKVNTAQDGHSVDSDMEVRIDDILYNACILHCYGKSIDEITEERRKCDWFIPIVNGEGIYIEYWGMKSPKYLEERAEKEALYKKHNIPYIGIEADDPKKDTLTFRSNLIRDLTKLAEEHYGFMPKWKR